MSVCRSAKELFIKIFGYPESAERFFSITDDDNILTEYIDGRCAGMLCLLPSSCDGINGGYIYGACTDTDLRRRGIFKALMHRAKILADARGYEFICLVPQHEYLFDIYCRLGYTGEVYRKTYENRDFTRGVRDDAGLMMRYNKDKSPRITLEDKYFMLWASDADYAIVKDGYAVYRDGILYECSPGISEITGKTLFGLYKSLTGDCKPLTVNGIYLD